MKRLATGVIMFLLLCPNSAMAQAYKVTEEITFSNIGTGSLSISAQIPLYNINQEEVFSLQPLSITSGAFDTRMGTFQIEQLKPNTVTKVSIDYIVDSSSEEAISLEPYLNPSTKIESNATAIKDQAFKLCKPTNAETAKAIYDFVVSHVSYDSGNSYANKGALSAFNKGKGVCEDQSCLFVALCRASGIPSRIVNGFAHPQRILLWSDGDSLVNYRHTWAECYINGAWTPVDCTFQTYGYVDESHIPQNYQDQNITSVYYGYSQLKVEWNEVYHGTVD